MGADADLVEARVAPGVGHGSDWFGPLGWSVILCVAAALLACFPAILNRLSKISLALPMP